MRAGREEDYGYFGGFPDTYVAVGDGMAAIMGLI